MVAGGMLALGAAVAFGGTTPLVQRFGRGMGPFTTAALLYAGSALFAAIPSGPRHAPLRRSDLPRLMTVALLGAVVALVQRDGDVRSFPIRKVNSRTMSALLRKQVSKKVHLMTDDSNIYPKIGKKFNRHSTVNHSIEEYVRGDVYTNNAENYFSILKRGIIGTYHHISNEHMPMYLAEFDFRYNNRSKLGVNDPARAAKALKGIVGKRLTYRRPDEKPLAQA